MRFFHHRPLVFFITFFLLTLTLSVSLSLHAKILAISIFAIASLLLLLPVLLRVRAFRRPLVLCLTVAFSLLVSLFGIDARLATFRPLYGTPITAEARIDKITGKDYTLRADCTLLSANGEDCKAKIKCSFPAMTELEENDRFTATLTLLPLDEQYTYAIADGFYCSATDITDITLIEKGDATLTSRFSTLRKGLSARITRSVNGEGGNLLCALLLGERDSLSGLTGLNFRRIGITHILALSGMHLSILTGALYFLLRRLCVPRSLRIASAVLLVLFYMAITDFSSSILRAGFMLFLTGASFFVARRADTVTSLFVSVFLICLFTPWAVYDAGLWLSMFGVIGLLFASFYFDGQGKKKKKKKPHRVVILLRGILFAFVCSVCASLMTLPLSALYFGETSLLAPLANLVFSPLLTFCIYLSILLLLLPLPSVIASYATGFCNGILDLADRFAEPSGIFVSLSHPFLLSSVLLTFLALLLLLSSRIRSWRAPLLILLSFCTALGGFLAVDAKRRDAYLEMTVLSEANGDYLLLSEKEGSLLVDMSSFSKTAVSDALAIMDEKRLTELDYYLPTHYSYRLYDVIEKLAVNVKLYTLLLPPAVSEGEELIKEELLSLAEGHGIQTLELPQDSSYSVAGGTLSLLGRNEDFPYGILTFTYREELYTFLRYRQLRDDYKNAATVVAASDYLFLNCLSLQEIYVHDQNGAERKLFLCGCQQSAEISHNQNTDTKKVSYLFIRESVTIRIKR